MSTAVSPVISSGPFGLGPYLKFIAPAVLALLGAVIDGLVVGDWDRVQMEIMVVGLLSATVSFVVANGSDGVKRYAKALAPALLTIVGIGLHWLFTGEWNNVETAGAVTGLLAAFVTLVTGNAPLVAVAPVTRSSVVSGVSARR